MVIVSDTSTISNLFLINKLWILENLYHKIFLPRGVFDELEKMEEDSSITIDAIRTAKWIEIVSVKNTDLVEILMLSLDKGEFEAIALAKENLAGLLIIDEIKGRRYAKQLNLNIIGLVGILLLAKQKKLIESVKDIMMELKVKAGFWVSESLLEMTLKLADEHT